MKQTEKQRTFVYLRQLEGGRESGYARAEIQDRTVNLHIAVQGFSSNEDTYAFAVTDEGVVLLGMLKLDARGQGGAAVQLSRKDYRDTQVLFVLRDTPKGVQIPLAGTPGRTGRVDWEAVKTLAVQALHPEEQESAEKEQAAEPEPKIAEIMPEPEQNTAEPEEDAESPEAMYDLAAQEEPYREAERGLRTPIAAEKRVEMPQLLRNAYWPQSLWPLHDLFERFEEEPSVEKDCAFIRIPLDGKYGTVEYYLMGARVKDGWVTAVGYLIPGDKQHPTGMAGSVYKDGYWQMWREAENE